jgi:glucose-6-phosphate 1-epimerase
MSQFPVTASAIPGIAEIVPGQNSLSKIQITTPAANAEIYLHGAQITSWKPAGHEEVLFLSTKSKFEDGKAIRGGIPICFPWFRAKSDNPKAPAHGLVRTKAWQLESITQQHDAVVVTLATESDESTRSWFPHDYRATLQITVGASLQLQFTAANKCATAFQFEAALHTYNRVADARHLSIAGLDQTAYLDNRDNNAQKTQSGDFQFTRDTDNAYLNTESPVEILDPVLHRRIRLEKQGSRTTVVWNPWQDDAAKLADLGDTEWREFACVEAANILSAAVTLHPGEEHTTTAFITVENLESLPNSL